MRALLVSMPDTTFNLKVSLQSIPNLALCSLAGNLSVPDCEVKILDLMYKPTGITNTLRQVMAEFDPQVVGLTTWTFQYESCKRIAQIIRRCKDDICIVAGGYHPSLCYDEISASEDADLFDFVVRGEGEITFNELIKTLKQGTYDFENIQGLSWKKNGQFVHNPPRPLADLSEFKLPDRKARILKPPRSYHKVVDLAETSRGCYMNCNFCSITAMLGKSFRTYPVGWVIEDLAAAQDNGAEAVFFVDDNITLDVEHFEEICEAIIANKLNRVRYYIQASSVGIASSERLVKTMKEAGFYAVFLGVENVSEHNLKYLQKGNIVAKSIQAVEYLKKYDIRIFGGFMVGNPDDTSEDIKRTFEFAKDLDVDYLALQILTPYPKTKLREDFLKTGLITNVIDYTKYNGFHCNVRTHNLSSRKLRRLVELGYLKYTWHMIFNSNNLWTKPRFSMKNVKLAAALGVLMASYVNGKWCRSDFHRF